jgi:uncharacterized protein YbaA (DUF1428 family)
MSYVDGFVIPVPKKNLRAYTHMAKQACKIWLEHGAVQYFECVGDDLDVPGGMMPFPKQLALKPGETVVFAWVIYKSRAHRDRVNAKIMSDPRMAEMMKGKSPFDTKRMLYGGFKTIVTGSQRKRAAQSRRA